MQGTAWRYVAISVASSPDVFTVRDPFPVTDACSRQCCDAVCSYAKAWHKNMLEQLSIEGLFYVLCFCRSLMQQVLRWRGGGMSLTGSIKFGTRYSADPHFKLVRCQIKAGKETSF